MNELVVQNGFEHIEVSMKLAEVMVTGKVMIPKHLQESKGDCLAVIMQATQWRMNPFVVAQKTFLINGKLGYEAQLVSAVINTNAPINDRIQYEYIGDWDKFTLGGSKDEKGLAVRAFAELKSGKIVDKTVYLSTVTTRNSTNWKTDPQQQLGYQAAVRLARQHFPEVLLGVYLPDELHGIDEKPQEPTPNVDLNAMISGDTQDAEIIEQPKESQKEILFKYFKNRGMKNPEIKAFITWSKLNTDDESAIESFLSDQAGAESSIETFYAEQAEITA